MQSLQDLRSALSLVFMTRPGKQSSIHLFTFSAHPHHDRLAAGFLSTSFSGTVYINELNILTWSKSILTVWLFFVNYLFSLRLFFVVVGKFKSCLLWRVLQSTVTGASVGCDGCLGLMWLVPQSAVMGDSVRCDGCLSLPWRVSRSAVTGASVCCDRCLSLMWPVPSW